VTKRGDNFGIIKSEGGGLKKHQAAETFHKEEEKKVHKKKTEGGGYPRKSKGLSPFDFEQNPPGERISRVSVKPKIRFGERRV